MSTATLQPRTKSPLLYLLFAAILGLGLVYVKKDEPMPGIAEAIDTGITTTTALNGCNNFRLNDFKSPLKWSNQFKKRGFTLERVRDILQHGTKETYIDHLGKTMVRVTDPHSGDFIVIDPLDCKIWQIAPSTFLN